MAQCISQAISLLLLFW